VWAVSTVVNRHDEFRLTLTAAGEPAVWTEVHPAFSIFNQNAETFSSLWIPFVEDFSVFQHSMTTTIEQHRDARELFPQRDVPENTFDISAVPWVSFTGLMLDIENGYRHLAPIITLGRRVQHADGRSTLPIAVQIHHAAADGFHVARLVNQVQDLFDHPRWVTSGSGLRRSAT
jgi:chloramphenicol O-acetyltransferase type A